ncbi:MAG: AAA family ATPase [Bacteroidetes bacterium]|nr:AAA family ATPase [Bacteroidota bacterium]
MPELIIIAGANGVGKTTFARPYVAELGYDFLNADDIAKKLSDEGEPSPMVAAGRVFFERLKQALDNHQDVVVETTLSGSYINKVAKRARSANYKIKLIYIFIESPEACLERVKMRIAKGGHEVPEEDVKRRFYRSLSNFWDNFRSMVNEWLLFFNGDFGFQGVASFDGQISSTENPVLLEYFMKILRHEK